MPNGAKYWRFKYRIGGVEQSPYAIGVYPEVSLKQARAERDLARQWLRQGAGPEARARGRESESEDPPAWLPVGHAQNEFRRLAGIMVKNRLLTEANVSLLAIFCALHARLIGQ